MSVDLVGFLGVVLVAYLVPGPDFLVVVQAAAAHPSKGRAAALGAQTGLCVHMLAAAVGLSLIAARTPVVFQVVKLLGAAYLVYLGVRAVSAARRAAGARAARRKPATGRTGREYGPGDAQDSPGDVEACADGSGLEAGASGAEAGRRGRWRSGFRRGLLTNVLNPKAALFFLSVLPQFVHGEGSPARQIFLLGVLDVLIGVVYWFALVAVAARMRAFLARPDVRRRWELTTGWLFIAVGVGVAGSA
ncbi:LysE family translocator [Streptomyces fragilis]|uniref:LysE family translocator n=1 Tax=Streptomyces fragilis TaxID=67301 RepID=A0ABV2YJF0_9ACTN|nr:LysE family translocator [Streptomyces fragilis]